MREAISNWVPGTEPRSCSINLDPSQFPQRCAALQLKWEHCRQLPPSSELKTKVREDFTITEKAPIRAFSLLKASTSGFTLKIYYKTLC